MNLTGYELVDLQSGVDYSPQFISTSKLLKGSAAAAANGPGYYSPMPVFKILITSNNNTGNIKLWGIGNDDDGGYVEIPKSSLKVGEEYNIYLKKFEAAGITMVGYTSKNLPIELC